MTTIKQLNILVVDDEAAGRGILVKLLPTILNTRYTIHEANSVANALDCLYNHAIDLVFLDVQMPEQNGFDLLKQVNQINFEVIFVTGFDQYAITAFRFNAIDYLLKPVDVNELKAAINKAITKINFNKNQINQTNTSLDGIIKSNIDKRIAVHINDKVQFINLPNICHILASNNYSEIIDINKQKFIVAHLLKEIELYLHDCPCFVRVNRNTMINVNHIQTYTKNNPCIVEMKGGQLFEISRRRKAEVLQLFGSL